MIRIWDNWKTPPPPWVTHSIAKELQASLPCDSGWSVSVDWCWRDKEWSIWMRSQNPPVCVHYRGTLKQIRLCPSAWDASDALTMTRNWPCVSLRRPATIGLAVRSLVQKTVMVCEAWVDDLPTEWHDRDLYYPVRYSEERRAAARKSLQEIHGWASALAAQEEINL